MLLYSKHVERPEITGRFHFKDTIMYKVLTPNKSGIRVLQVYDENFYKTNLVRKDTPMYESIYLYEEKHKEILETTKSLAGIRDVVTDKVVFDFDNKDNPQLALDAARDLVGRLQGIGLQKDQIRCFFSGHKGYHIEIHFEKEYIDRKQFESIIYKFAGDLPFFDEMVKDEQRIFRFPLSRHEVTKAYKIPFIIDEFTDLENTHEGFAGEAMRPNWTDVGLCLASFTTTPIPEAFKNITVTNKKKKETKVEGDEKELPNMNLKPKFLTPAKYVLSLGFFEDGERNSACRILAAVYRFLNFTKNQAYLQIKNAVNERNRRLGVENMDDAGKTELWNTVIEYVYGPTWKGATYSDREDPLLLKTIERYGLEKYYNVTRSDVVSITDMGENFIKFADEIDSSIVKTGIPEIDAELLLTSSMMVGLLGAPSSGKTSIALNMLEYQSQNNVGGFFVSADMGNQLLFARLVQKYCSMGFKEILYAIQKKPQVQWKKELKNAWDIVMENYKNVGFSFNSGPAVVDINRLVEEHEQEKGTPVKFLVVDYLEKIRCDYSDATAATGYNASRLSDLTRNRDLTTLLLLQTQKASGDPSDELLSMRKVKGSSVLEQDMRVIMSTWRYGFNPDVKGSNPDDRFASIAVVKNNMGTTCKFDLTFDGISGRYSSLSDEELVEFERVKTESFARKAARFNGQQYTKPVQGAATGGVERKKWTAKKEMY